MDIRIPSMSLLNENHKLSRTTSATDLPISKKIVFEQERYDMEKNKGLYRRFSCEHVLDQATKIRHMKISETLSAFNTHDTNPHVSVGPTFTTTNSLWLQLPQTSFSEKKGSSLDAERINQHPNHSGRTNKGNIVRTLSCNDIYNNSTDTNSRRFNVNSSRNSVFKLPALPPTPPTPPKDSTESLSFNRHSSESNEKSLFLNFPTSTLFTPKIKKDCLFGKNCGPPPKERRMIKRLCWSISWIFFISVLVVFIGLSIKPDDLVMICAPDMNFSSTVTELQKRVYGQNDAVHELSTFLQSAATGFHIISLVGGTGVGKTHTANIMREVMDNEFRFIEYVPSMIEKHQQAYIELAACKCNLVILDNVKSEDIELVAKFCKDLKEHAKYNCGLVLVLVNTQEVNKNLDKFIDLDRSLKVVKASFEEKNLKIKVFGYKPLEVEILDHCILEAAEHSNMTLSSKNIAEIRNDLINSQSGCKGAFANVQVLGKEKK